MLHFYSTFQTNKNWLTEDNYFVEPCTQIYTVFLYLAFIGRNSVKMSFNLKVKFQFDQNRGQLTFLCTCHQNAKEMRIIPA